jgi:hypothetical protein
MPLLKLETTVALPDEKKKSLLAALSKAVADTIGKPEQYVMVSGSQSAMSLSGKAGRPPSLTSAASAGGTVKPTASFRSKSASC